MANRLVIGVACGLLALVAVGVFIVMGSDRAVGGLASAVGESRNVPLDVLEQHELALQGGTGLALCVRGPVEATRVQALVDARRAGYALVRVFVYEGAAEPRKGAPAQRYDWTAAEGLKSTGMRP